MANSAGELLPSTECGLCLLKSSGHSVITERACARDENNVAQELIAEPAIEAFDKCIWVGLPGAMEAISGDQCLRIMALSFGHLYDAPSNW
jgi:hypothetical protein